VAKLVDEEQCRTFNADLMRTLIARKMAKQKSFYEMKVLPQQPVVIIPAANGRLANHLSGDVKVNAVFMKTQRVSAQSPQMRKISVNEWDRANSRMITK